MKSIKVLGPILALPLALIAGCAKKPADTQASAAPHRHEHKPPHGGTPVVLGDEVYHVELVLDAAAGKLRAYVFDGELENFIRSPVPSFEIEAVVDGATRTLVLAAVPDSATGETVGDSSLFETQADWLKTTKRFDGVLKSIAVKGTTFRGVKFNFPKGNDKDS